MRFLANGLTVYASLWTKGGTARVDNTVNIFGCFSCNIRTRAYDLQVVILYLPILSIAYVSHQQPASLLKTRYLWVRSGRHSATKKGSETHQNAFAG